MIKFVTFLSNLTIENNNNKHILKKIISNINNCCGEKKNKRINNLLLLKKIRNDNAYYKNNSNIDKLSKQIHSKGLKYLYYINCPKIPAKDWLIRYIWGFLVT